MASKKGEGDRYKLELTESARLGEYSNFVKVQHSGIDFRFDFAKILPEDNVLYVHTRLFMSPVHAKLFLKALEDNIQKYEELYGTIQLKLDRNAPVPGMPSTEKH